MLWKQWKWCAFVDWRLNFACLTRKMKTADLTEQTKSPLFTVIREWQNLKGSLFDNLKLTYYLFWDFKSPIKLLLSSMQPNCKLKTGIFSVGLMQMLSNPPSSPTVPGAFRAEPWRRSNLSCIIRLVSASLAYVKCSQQPPENMWFYFNSSLNPLGW